jgi:hypothetical protein
MRKTVLSLVAAAIVFSATVVPAFADKKSSAPLTSSSGWTQVTYADGALD